MIVIAFYVVPFITSWGRLLQEGTIERGVAIMEFYFVFYFFLCRASPVRVFIIGAVIFLLKNVCFVYFFCILFLLLFLGISLWLFVLIQALLVSI